MWRADLSRRLVHLARKVILPATALASVLAMIVALSTLWLLVCPPETTFNVVAETERIVMKVDRLVAWRWTFEQVTLHHGNHEETFTGSLQLGFPVEVAMERVGFGMLWISIQHEMNPGRGCRAATLFGPDEEARPPIPCEFDIRISDIPERAAQGQTTVLTLEGEISAGRPVGFQTQGTGTALLRSGRVTLRERTLLNSTQYDMSTRDLDAGDFLRVGQVSSHGLGFAVVDERPAMTAAFRVIGQKATIERPGGGEAPLAGDILSRFSNDVDLQALIAMIVALAGLISLSVAIVEGLKTRA